MVFLFVLSFLAGRVMQDIRFFRRSQQYLVAETNRMCSAEQLIIRDQKKKERVLHGVDVRVLFLIRMRGGSRRRLFF